MAEALAGERDAATLAVTSAPVMRYGRDGVEFSEVGDGGDWMALGHVRPARLLAAVSGEAASQGYDPLQGMSEPELTVRHTRAVFVTDPADPTGWFCWWDESAQDHPAAVDITIWSP